jgi:hypothetical protein
MNENRTLGCGRSSMQKRYKNGKAVKTRQPSVRRDAVTSDNGKGGSIILLECVDHVSF